MTMAISDQAAAPPPSGPPRWMMSFADLMSVVLTFFVLMFSMSAPPEVSHKEANEMKHTTEADYSIKKNDAVTEIKIAKTDQDLSTNYLSDILSEKMAAHPELVNVNLIALPDRLVLSTATSNFNNDIVRSFALIFKTINNRMEIYSSNLDQSYLVMQKLQQNGFKKNISFYQSESSAGKIDIVIYP